MVVDQRGSREAFRRTSQEDKLALECASFRKRRPYDDSGLYQLVIRLRAKRVIAVGRLGRFLFPAGYYVYTGSARRGLEARVARHMRRRKRMRWHIDYLLRHGAVIEVKRYGIGGLSECELSRRVEEVPGSGVVAPGFGSSDCGCATHLFRFSRDPALELGRTRPGPCVGKRRRQRPPWQRNAKGV